MDIIAVIYIDGELIKNLFLGFVAVCIILIVVKLARPRWLKPNRRGGALLLQDTNSSSSSFYTGASFKTPKGYSVIYIAGMTDLEIGGNTRTIYMVDLPFVTTTHLVGVPTKYSYDFGPGHADRLEPMSLEGDYNNYFHLFIDKNQQLEGRYVLDPKAMAFSVDFCKEFYWEIRSNALFFSSSQKTMPSLEIVDKFIDEIRPEVEEENTRRNANTISYTLRDQHTMLCPICSVKLVETDYWLACPEGHGCLTTGKQLVQLRRMTRRQVKKLTNSIKHTVSERPNSIDCTYCSFTMNHSVYPGTEVTIDICSRCGYRWFDQTELPNILT